MQYFFAYSLIDLLNLTSVDVGFVFRSTSGEEMLPVRVKRDRESVLPVTLPYQSQIEFDFGPCICEAVRAMTIVGELGRRGAAWEGESKLLRPARLHPQRPLLPSPLAPWPGTHRLGFVSSILIEVSVCLYVWSVCMYEYHSV